MQIAIATPSRGLIHSRTAQGVFTNVQEAQAKGHRITGWFFTHDLPLPECHNRVTKDALASGADSVWFVEEDNIPPPGALLRLVDVLNGDASVGLAICDYPVGKKPYCNCAAHEHGGPEEGAPPTGERNRLLWCGLGCTLVRRKVFEGFDRMGEAYFDTASQFQIVRFGRTITHLKKIGNPYPFGGEDIYFAMVATQSLGWTIQRIDPKEMMCGHALLEEWGHKWENNGCHRISVRGREQVQRWI